MFSGDVNIQAIGEVYKGQNQTIEFGEEKTLKCAVKMLKGKIWWYPIGGQID